MNRKDRALLKKNGWTIECESPLAIRKEGSFALDEAAQIVLDFYKLEKGLTNVFPTIGNGSFGL